MQQRIKCLEALLKRYEESDDRSLKSVQLAQKQYRNLEEMYSELNK